MNTVVLPVLTVRGSGSQRTFAAGHDVVIGRDLRADMRITHQLISRTHLLLRFDQGRWLAIDNCSCHGTFVKNRRVQVVDIYDGQTINIGKPDGPWLTFELGRHPEMAGRPPQTAPIRTVQLPGTDTASAARAADQLAAPPARSANATSPRPAYASRAPDVSQRRGAKASRSIELGDEAHSRLTASGRGAGGTVRVRDNRSCQRQRHRRPRRLGLGVAPGCTRRTRARSTWRCWVFVVYAVLVRWQIRLKR
ncbi:MAG TPA: FHA domain-containing protein [Mycobacterium sp.]|nr:FHA domain-containing protein [Mycobacterium sp.]